MVESILIFRRAPATTARAEAAMSSEASCIDNANDKVRGHGTVGAGNGDETDTPTCEGEGAPSTAIASLGHDDKAKETSGPDEGETLNADAAALAKDSSEASNLPELAELPDLALLGQKYQPPDGSPPTLALSQCGHQGMDKPPPSSAAPTSRHTKAPSASPAAFIVCEDLPTAPHTPDHLLRPGLDREDANNSTKHSGAEAPPFPPETHILLPEDHRVGSEVVDPQQQPTTTAPTPETASEEEAMAIDHASKPLAGPPLCEGDTALIQNFLPPSLIEGLFERLNEEVQFKKMMHQGGEVPRFIAVQGAIAPDGTQPVYRHPSDEAPPLAAFTPAVQLIRGHVERQLGHPVNHVLIQCYRTGNDYISEHSDKTLDVDRWSYIANVSVGAMRTMVFRSKRVEKKEPAGAAAAAEAAAADRGGHQSSSGSSTPLDAIDRAASTTTKDTATAPPPQRQTTRCPMPHNSLIKMGLLTNEKWLHGIKPDKRRQVEKSAAERAWNGMRISLTFRHIVTFLSPAPARVGTSSSSRASSVASPEPLIWGQGAVAKTRAHAAPVINGQTPEAVLLLRAFGRENNSPDFDWEANYGRGFDVLHMKAAPRYFGCGDDLVDGKVRIMLAECGVKYARGDIGIKLSNNNNNTCKAKRGSLLLGGRTSTSLSSAATAPRRADVGEVLPVRFVVDDADRTTVVGDVAILLFLDAKHPRKRGSDSEVAGVYSRFYAAIALEQRWKGLWASAAATSTAVRKRKVFGTLKTHLVELEKWAAEAARREEEVVGIADFALWPVLHDVALAWKTVARGRGVGVGKTVFGHLGLWALDGYYRDFAERESVLAVFGVDAVVPVLLEPGAPVGEESEEEEEEGDGESDGVVEDPDNTPGKGKLPRLTEFGGQKTSLELLPENGNYV